MAGTENQEISYDGVKDELGKLMKNIKHLPDIPRLQIMGEYIEKNYNLRWISDKPKVVETFLNPENYVLFDNYSKGYISLTEKEFENLTYKRYPEAKYKLSYDEAYFLDKIDQVKRNAFLKRSIDKTVWDDISNRCIFAGGMFTEYNPASPFAHVYPQIFDYCAKSTDIDLWIHKENKTGKREKYKKNQEERIDITSMDKGVIETKVNKEINVTLLPVLEKNPCEDFDFDACKLFYTFNKPNRISIHSSLLVENTLVYEPSFANPITIVTNPIFLPPCICVAHKRSIKYFFKGFYHPELVINELKLSKEIFEQPCPVCKKHIFSFK